MFFFCGGKNGAKYARQQCFGLGCLIEKVWVWGRNLDMGDNNNSDEAAALRLSSDFKLKECPAFIGSTGREGKGPKVWAFNDADIPLSISGFNDKKQVSVGLVVVDCSMSGYTRVPYECTSGDRYKVRCFFCFFLTTQTYRVCHTLQVGKNALPLSEKSVWPGDPEGQLHMLTCWPYGIVEGCPKDKDDRNEEYKWEVGFWAIV